MKKLLFPLFSLIVGTTFALALVEAGLRLLGVGYGNAPLESDPLLHHVHPKQYTFLSYTPNNEYGGFHVHYDKLGLRASTETKHKVEQPAKCRIAFLGDSFTEAGQVRHEESFVGLVEQKSDCEIRNYGVSSYSPIFFLAQWRQTVKQYKPTTVIIQLFSNDISGDEEFKSIATLDAQGMPTAIPGPPNDWLSGALRNSYTARLIRKSQIKLTWWMKSGQPESVVGGFVEENPDISPFSSNLMKTLFEEIRASGAEFAMFVVPSKYRLANPRDNWPEQEFSDKWKHWAANNGVQAFVDVTGAFRRCMNKGQFPFFRSDIHFNEIGHAIVANKICHDLSRPLGIRNACDTSLAVPCLTTE